MTRGGALAVLLCAAGCFDREFGAEVICTTVAEELRVYTPGVLRVDLLVLVDDGAAMAEEQAVLAEQLPRVILDLVAPLDIDGDTGGDHPPVDDVNVAILTPDMGTAGFLVPSCAHPEGGERGCFRRSPRTGGSRCSDTYPPFLSRTRDNDWFYSGERLAQDAACLARLGTGGCVFEQPFRATLAAVGENAAPGGCNEGFLREGAPLVLLWIADHDDASVRADHPEFFDPAAPLGEPQLRGFLHPELLEPMGTYVAAFRALEADRPFVALGMIVGVPPGARCTGPGDALDGCLARDEMVQRIDPAAPSRLLPSCASATAAATPSRRFVELAQAFGDQARVVSICDPDWLPVTGAFTDRLPWCICSLCFPQELDLDLATCQTPCTVVETLEDDRPCERDAACPPERCPPASSADVGLLPPCVDPATGETCEPLHRDLGLVAAGDGTRQRECLLRQAVREFDATAARCGVPLEAGWYYEPPAWTAEGCPQLEFSTGGRSWITGSGSRLTMRCFREVCTDEEPCGPAASPAAVRCRRGETCVHSDPTDSGVCVPR